MSYPLEFGTDGLRGRANLELTPELVLALGRAAARVLGGDTFIIGRDTRVSGPMLQSALAAGMSSEGIAVVDLGIVPTPTVAFACAQHHLAGAVVTASHNPYADNGIKLFAAGGLKLSLDIEAAIEREMAVMPSAGATVGRLSVDNDARRLYHDHLVATLEGRRLEGMRVVIDCANGAASELAPSVLRSLGADVSVLHDRPDGTNINEGCGSTFPGPLGEAVVEEDAHVGLAFDGDADRVVAVDERGDAIDGDHLMAMCALDLAERDQLAGNTVVVTVMTNLGFRQAMDKAGIDVRETQVGDRHVLQAMEEGGFVLGGEQSGHVIFRRLATTGDGILTGLQLLDLLHRSQHPLSELAADAMTALPQVLRSVTVDRPQDLADAAAVWDEVTAVEAELGSGGRVVIRTSGTERVVRIMVEAPSEAAAMAAVERLASAAEVALA